MNKLLAIALAALSLAAQGMPTKAQLDEVKPIVQELMAPLVKDYNAKRKLASEVADGAMALVAEADTEAAKFALIRGAVTYYARAKAYDKAADAIESLVRHIPDIPAPTLYEITSKAAANTTARTAPRLAALNAAAKKRAAVAARRASVAKELRKTPADLRLLRLDAELAAASGDWDAALAQFAKLGGDTARIAAADADATGSDAEVADFWWNYAPAAPEAKDAIRAHAANLYRRAIDSGALDGLKRTLAEKRIAEVPMDDAPVLPAVGKTKIAAISPRLKKGLVGYWPFDGNADDASGNRNNGIPHGVVPCEDRFGNPNGAYRFDKERYVEVPNSPSLQNIVKSISMIAWVRPTAWYNRRMSVMQKGDQREVQFNLQCFMGKCYCYSGTSPRGHWTASALASGINLGEWSHISAVYETGDSFRFYVNGKLTGVGGAAQEMVAKSLPLLIGCDPIGSTEYFIGDMDDVRIYDRALSEAEIQELYKAEAPAAKK